jgi:hypothetical protein
MNVICHEAVSLNSNPLAFTALFPQRQIELVIFQLDKAGFAVVTALNIVAGIIWQVYPFTSRHSISFAMNN